jgi:NapC/NirT cytochrome c family, N-terminal region
MNPFGVLAVLTCLLGIPAGIGAFTFVYAKGYSYLSTDPRTCLNCHIMGPQYDAWLKSGHRHAAVCVDCHLPHGGLGNWMATRHAAFRQEEVPRRDRLGADRPSQGGLDRGRRLLQDRGPVDDRRRGVRLDRHAGQQPEQQELRECPHRSVPPGALPEHPRCQS